MLQRNLVANYLGNSWTALVGIVVVPLYIKYIGIESYGLIGLFALMQAWLSLLDMGMTPTLNREMGRFTGGAQSASSIRDLLRSVEVVVVVVGCLIVFGVWAGAGWLATEWLQMEDLSVSTVGQALSIMGLVIALQFVSSIYRSSLIGLQRQVLFNTITSVTATIRAIGAVAVLAWIAPTLQAFFIWQGVISIVALLLLMAATYQCLPRIDRRGRFSLDVLKRISSYAGGMVGITFLTLLLTQIDKILLSRLLTLSDFGLYTVAALVAGGLRILLAAIAQALYPRLSQLHAENNNSAFVETYHEGAQLVSVIVGSAALVLITFSEPILLLWTQDAELASRMSILVRWLAFGNLLNAFLTMPYQAQLAYGWTGFAIRVNTIAVVVIVPAIYFAVTIYGMVGAAIVWALLNLGYILIGMHYMYKRILTTEKWRWYREDVLRPMLTATTMAILLSLVSPDYSSNLYNIFQILLCSLLVFVAAILGAPKVLQRVRVAVSFPNKRKLRGVNTK